MVDQTYHVLEFDKLLHIVSEYAVSPLGQSDCLSLKPISDPHRIDLEQRMVSEMKLLLSLKGFFAFEGLTDIESVLKKSRVKGSCLKPEAFLSIMHIAEACQVSSKTIRSQADVCFELSQLIKEMPSFTELIKSIHHTIHVNGTVKDSASHELKNLRRRKRDLRRNLQKRLEEIKRSLDVHSEDDDHLITIREGRYVIPLRTEKKNKIPGIIHDYSHTKATCFFEPLDAIEDNNQLGELNYLEKEEEYKILTDLTDTIRVVASDLSMGQALLAKLDGLCARARYSDAVNGIRPIINPNGLIDLRDAKNPILMSMATKGNPPVPADISMDRDVNVMIISGPNRGGKTVTLKTLGLLSLMAQSGLHIPASEGSQLPVFKRFFAEIGDEQDIQAGLSTFSAHISHLKNISDHADQDSLIIIDEPGMGTDPDEGAALAMALLDTLSQKGALVVVSTHYNRLKSYGLLSDRVKNASMKFDEQTNRPTFQLVYGSPGTSYAFEIAQDQGIDPRVIERARQYLDEDEVRLNRLIDKLNQLKQETIVEKAEAEHHKKKYLSVREKLHDAIKRLESDKEAFIQSRGLEADQLIKDSREEFKKVINSFKNKEGSQKKFVKEFNEISNRLMDHFQIVGSPNRPTGSSHLSEGQWVRHKLLGQKGRIISLDTDNAKASIVSGSIKLSVNIHDLEVLPGQVPSEPIQSQGVRFHQTVGPFAREINLIGYRVADALPVLDKVIDKTMVEGDASLRIIHGHGTGRLKSAIRNHLKGFACVKRICSADPQSGGDAITIVELT